MSKPSDLTAYARAGYDGNPNPHIYSSPCWYAHSLGMYLHRNGHNPPFKVRMSRGSKMHANGMLFEYTVTDRGHGWTRHPDHIGVIRR